MILLSLLYKLGLVSISPVSNSTVCSAKPLTPYILLLSKRCCVCQGRGLRETTPSGCRALEPLTESAAFLTQHRKLLLFIAHTENLGFLRSQTEAEVKAAVIGNDKGATEHCPLSTLFPSQGPGQPELPRAINERRAGNAI